MTETAEQQTVSSDGSPSRAQPNARLWIETGVVLALTVVPDTVNSLALWIQKERAPLSYTMYSLLIIVGALQVTVPVLYIMARSGEAWSAFALARPVLVLDVPAAVAVWFVIHVLYQRVLPHTSAADAAAAAQATLKPQSFWQYALLALWSASNGFAEELVLRGFLLHRFRQLCGSVWPSLFLTSILFGVYHLHYGPVGALNIMLQGAVYGASVLLLGRLWPAALAHAIDDFVLSA